MPVIQLFFVVATIVWVLLGIIFFTWLRFDRLKRRIRDSKTNIKIFAKNSIQLVKDSKPKIKEFGKASLLGSTLLAPFLIPIIVTMICLFFG